MNEKFLGDNDPIYNDPDILVNQTPDLCATEKVLDTTNIKIQLFTIDCSRRALWPRAPPGRPFCGTTRGHNTNS